MFETELLTVFNTLKLNASISGDDEDTFDVLSELESAMDDLLSLAPEMLETELEFDVYATNKTSCQRECAKGNHCCNYDESVGSNQRLSCLQACMVRVSGVSKSECDASCSSDGCTKFGYSLCSDCTDVISSNACSSYWGSSTDTCLAGCRIGRAVHYLTDATIQSAITNCLSESPVDGLCTTYGLITTKFGTMPDWDVSRVTDMGGGTWLDFKGLELKGFGGRSTFNADISKWNTEKVTTMRYMFYKASAFDQDIGNWNTGKVTTMRNMFRSASAFNQDIGGWNTAQVTDMHDMFSVASAFNQEISSWNTEKVTDMGYMFFQASAFNQDIGNWTTAQVTTMHSMFYSGFWDNGNASSASAFNQDIGRWNTGKVTTMRYMFSYAFAFNQDIGGWDTAQVTTMYSMFYSASAFNQDIGNWNTGKVINMYGMFTSASAFNQDIGRWNTEKVTDMRYIGDENGGMRFMFQSASAFNHDISSWTGSAATSAQTDMFLDATAFQAKFTCTNAITGPASSCVPK
ncbi:unnamed protein product [Bathycoccus prasinos]